jgi:hypothetical protein
MRKSLLSGVAVIGAMLFLAGCEGGDAPRAAAARMNIVYSQDPRTGLCFASVLSLTYSGYGVISITSVPCEKVEKLL